MMKLSPKTEFELSHRPKGLIARYSTKFIRKQISEPSTRNVYLVKRPSDGEIVAGRVIRLDVGFWFQADNHKDRVSDFSMDNTDAIVAEHKGS